MKNCDKKSAEENQRKLKDDRVVDIIRVLNNFIAITKKESLETASRILHTAKEDLVYWAVEMDFHETAKDAFVNKKLYGSTFDENSPFLQKMISHVYKKDEHMPSAHVCSHPIKKENMELVS